MHEAIAVHAGADACLVEEIDRDLLDHARADAAEHMLAGMALDNHVVDAVVMEELSEQKAGRAGADNGNLRPHGSLFAVALHGSGSAVIANGRKPAAFALIWVNKASALCVWPI
jgi:hypothetical protein